LDIKFHSVKSKLVPDGFVLTLATIIITGILIAAAPVLTHARMAKDSVAIRAQIEAYRNVWNTHRPAALAGFFAEDADMVIGNLTAAHGRHAIQDWWSNYFAGQEPERNIAIAVNTVRIIAADVAVVNVATTTGGRDAHDKALLSRKARGTWLLRRDGGEWLISAMRGFPTEEDSVDLILSQKATDSLKPQIRALVRGYEEAFNNHDPSAVSAFYRKDADILVRNDPLIHGSEAIEKWWRAYFSQPRPYRALLIIDEIRLIEPDVALINIIGTGAPLKADSAQAPLRYTRGTWVVVRDGGEWRIAALWVLPGLEDRIIRRSSR
jgi:uncharacterized protein (TIGR02246 family)